eukprot:TRINITY_DN6606_c0_g1_i3.p1 TRINITY_DN6606_c0_g1~~TRINITY_DN6606_c0_g1_i3.p1  ORF type:complete len:560 (-),score=121.99 TRINITY_DN6606_c0_g1_i3:88-1767(-)
MMWLARATRTRLAPGLLCLSRRGAASFGTREKLQAEYQRRIEEGQLETDHVQMRVIDFLATTLDEASMRSRSMLAEAKRRQQEQEQKQQKQEQEQEQEEPVLAEASVQGWVGRPGWVLPIRTLGAGNQSTVEDHARVAEYTARLAAENAQRVRKQAGHSRSASAALPAQAAMPQVAAAVPSQPASTPVKAPSRQQVAKAPRRSVYLHGPVGTGKTMLLDLFYQNAKEAGLRTLRQHFYEFMLGLHRQIHRIREDRPVEVAANSLADDIDVFCFDEFQITDIQDAAILPRLFEVLFLRGVAVVMTSNTSPQLLYSGGLNRHVHLPAFIGLMAEHSTVLGLKSSVDYRRKAEAAELAKASSADAAGEMSHDAFLAGADAEERLAARWTAIQAEVGCSATELVLQLPMGRTLQIAQSAGPACLLSFHELCGRDRGEADFFALSERFRIILLSGVPRFSGLEDADMVRRFVKLLDLLYDRRVRLVVAAAAPLGELFGAVREEVGRGDMSDLAWRTAMYSADGKVGLNPQAVGTLCEAVRATERAESRLREMRTRRYWKSCADQ